jgi:3D (Asp-Asp-Asp) domain-containing protein
LGQALWEKGIILSAADRPNLPLVTPLAWGLEVLLERARAITVQTQAASFTLRTAASTVSEALAELGLALQGLDYSLPPASAPLPTDGTIRLVRVSEEVLIEQTPLEFETQYQPVSDLELDNQTILQTGEYGLVAQRVRVRYEDGVEVSRQVEDEWIAREPQARIVGYGTQIVMRTTTVDGITIQYWRAITMWATSYHPSETSPTTASGLPLEKGVCAVDIRYIPFYTNMYVPGYGAVIAADVGGGVIGRMIDLGYSDDDYVPWHQYVTVYFLWPPPENIAYIFP